MKTVVEPLEGNKVRLSVEVDEAEFEKALDAAFRRIAAEVRVPGFRPGKAPRRVLEARIGRDAARQEALRGSLPDYYAEAVKQNEVDPIAPPEIDIKSGEESGPLSFEAVVEVRPTVAIPGYQGLQVTIPRPDVSEEDIDAQIDRLRDNDAELREVARPAVDGDHVTIDISGYRHGERFDGLSAEDFLYPVGSGAVVAELDEQLRGSRAGDILKFNAEVPEQGEVSFQVLVKDVKEKVLPQVTDEWASDASEFATVEELRADIRRRMEAVRRVQAILALRDEALRALVGLVTEDAPGPLVDEETERRAHDLAHRLEAQGASLADYLAATGAEAEQLSAELRASAVEAVKGDLALRALADAESVEVDESEVDEEIVRLAEQLKRKPAQVRRDLERAEQLTALRTELRKNKALAWLVDNVQLVDPDGRPIDRAELEAPQPPETAAGVTGEAGSNPEEAGEPAEQQSTTESQPTAEATP
ncbi:MAG TPA: trigger factor [Acidimicrobiales bacterium]|nr:trigger factor [Acidimicrobiales bacterium]